MSDNQITGQGAIELEEAALDAVSGGTEIKQYVAASNPVAWKCDPIVQKVNTTAPIVDGTSNIVIKH